MKTTRYLEMVFTHGSPAAANAARGNWCAWIVKEFVYKSLKRARRSRSRNLREKVKYELRGGYRIGPEDHFTTRYPIVPVVIESEKNGMVFCRQTGPMVQ